jgi:GT2 family glycosyltransferase
VALLNDDVRLDRNWLELTSALLDSRPDVSFCCGKIYQADGATLDNAGDALSLGGSAWRLGFGRPDSEEFAFARQVFAVPGTAALLRRSVFEQVGLLDEDFFSYLEDVDFSLRSARAGYRGLYLPQATCLHQGSATLGTPDAPAMFRLLTQNQLMILVKHYPWKVLFRLGPRIAWSQFLWAAMAIRKNRLGAYLSGVAHFFRLFKKTLWKRRSWQKDELQEFVGVLRESEREIYEDVSAADRDEQDTFWKLYFALFPPPRKQEYSVKPGMKRFASR